MLHLIFGRAGSGKTEYIRRLASEQIRAGGDVMIIVPEQGSFDCERAMLRLLGPQNVRHAEVLSFTRLVNRVGRSYGGFAGRRLDDTGRALFMSLALEQVQDRLTLYRKSVENSDFIHMLLGLSAACKMGAVTPTQLSVASAGMTGTLRSKTEELAMILGAYDALIAESFLDPLDDLTRLAEQLRLHPFFAGRTVLLDAFKGFTAQEFDVLDAVIAQSADCWITLCTDGLDDPEQGTGLFSNVRKTARRLLDCARRHQVRVAAPVLLEPGARFCSDALTQVEAHLFRTGDSPECIADDSVQLIAASNKYEEAAWISAEIHRLVREMGYHWRDFAVIVRQESDYEGILDRALMHAGIPCFMDRPADVTAAPLMAYVLSALDAVNGRMDSDAVFRCLKTGLFGLNEDIIAELENYALMWNIDREAWNSIWKNHPRGFADEWTEVDRAALDRLNAAREEISGAFGRLSERIQTGTGTELAGAIYGFLRDTHAADHLRAAADALEGDGEPAVSDEQLRLWDLLMDLLDQAALVLRRPLDGKRFARLLELAIRSAKLGELPQSLDEVTVGGADRTRPSAPRVVFLAGAVQGVFPAAAGGGGLFTDHERRILADRGLEIVRSMAEQTVEERFLAYTAACSPSERLYVSMYGSASDGEGALPSELITECRRIFPGISIRSAGQHTLETENAAFEHFAAHYGENSVEQATLSALFADDPARQEAQLAIRRAAEPEPFRFTDPHTAQSLFGMRMTLSPSRVETYARCPFQYFCRYGMDAQERRPAKIDALEYGTLIHYLLEHMLRNGACAAPEPELRARVHSLLTEYLESHLGGAEGKSARFLALYGRFEAIAVQLLQYIAAEQRQSQFTPEAFELNIARGGDVPPVHIPLPDGGSIEVIGKIDRVDCFTHDGETYVRVIDYKTGAKKFSLTDILYGINMQMLIYLMTLHENGLAGRPVLPGGVLYLPARTPRIPAAHGGNAEEEAVKLMREMRMSGMVLREDSVIHAMEREGRGLYIPVKLKNDGSPDAASSLYTMAQFGRLSRHIQSVIRQMGSQLHAGHIPAAPVGRGCEYCRFAPVCGHEPNDPVVEIPSMSLQKAFQRLERSDFEVKGADHHA